jgi:membrane-anchored protein YejM (alkaline phosphatase superfamily)
MILAESPRRQRVTKLVNWGHWFALANIIIAIVIASIFVFSSPMPGTGVGTLYLLANWFGHIGFMTFFGFVIFILPLCYLVNNPRVIKVSASVIAAVGLALLAFDALLFNRTGFHISFHAADLLRSEAQSTMAIESWQQWAFLFLLFIVWLGFQLVLANAIWKRVERFTRHKVGIPVTTFFVSCFVTSHAIHVWADAKLYQPIIKQDNMFPLSYPATAKTTMSRYGLLDLAAYEERKQLQFNPDIHNITYPAEPVYCSIETNRNLTVVVQTDNEQVVDLSNIKRNTLNKVANYYSTASSIEGLMTTTLFGVPEIYQDALSQKRPVLLALPLGSGMPVSIHSDEALPLPQLAGYLQPLSNNHDGLHIAFLKSADIESYVKNTLARKHDVIVATGFGSESGKGTLYSTLKLNASLASTEDLAPTILGALGCNAPATFYSTGQSLLSPSRPWLVSTSGERIVVFHDNKRTDVLSNGSYEISDMATGKRSKEALNVDLLSQAIKHLSRFSTQN